MLKGVDPELELNASEALHRVAAGSADFHADADGIPAILIGRLLADDLKISAGDYLTLTSPQGSLTPFGMLPRSRRFRVAGIFDSGFYDYDANWTFVTLASGQAMMAGIGDVVSLLELRVNNLDDAARVAEEISRRAGSGSHREHRWMDENRALFRALSLEKTRYCIVYGIDYFRRRIEYSGGAHNDGDRPLGKRHCCTDGDGRPSAASAKIIRFAGLSRQPCGDLRWSDPRISAGMGSRPVEADSSKP